MKRTIIVQAALGLMAMAAAKDNATSSDRDASEAENAKRLSGKAVAARPEGHRPEHTTTEQGKRNAAS